MIAKGTAHAHGARLGQYLVTGKDGERATLHELRGFAEDDIVDAFRSVHILAAGTRCDQPFFHCQVRCPAGEQLSQKQWETVADRIERKLGLTDQPRALSFHDKDGERHMHVAWSRIDTDTMTAKPLPFFKLRLKEVCRELEQELDLTRVRNERKPNEPRAPSRGEFEQAKRHGLDPKAVRAAIRETWNQADGGKAFAAALDARGFKLAQGDRRDFVVIDPAGGVHALGKRLLGVSAGEIRQRLGDVERRSLPTAGEARAPAPKTFSRAGPGNIPNLVIRPGGEKSHDAPSSADSSPDLHRTVVHASPAVDEGRAAPERDTPGFVEGILNTLAGDNPAPTPTQSTALEGEPPGADRWRAADELAAHEANIARADADPRLRAERQKAEENRLLAEIARIKEQIRDPDRDR